MKRTFAFNIILLFTICYTANGQRSTANDLLLKNFRPVALYNIPKTTVQRAAYPVIDMHSHDYTQTQAEIDQWVKTMDEVGIEKIILLTYCSEKGFDSVVEKYKRYPTRFELWCGFDYTGYGTPGWSAHAIAELERCYRKGARGVGELGDKGDGDLYSKPVSGRGVHIDDPLLKPVLDKCGELKMPISIHIAEDQWMYETPDSSNDGLMNAAIWHVDMNTPGKLDHAQLITSLENAIRQHPGTTFIACHLANCCADLSKLGVLLDAHPNLYADIGARYSEIAPIPRYAAAFITKYQDRLVYGTDMGTDAAMYRITFHILETADEHFYEPEQFDYHWALYGLALPKPVLQKIYHENAAKILNRK